MLTAVKSGAQLQFTVRPLTLVSMNTLQSRIGQAMKHGEKSAADLARACKISRVAVGKWVDGTSKKIKTEHAFAVADACNVEPRWLALGKGPMERGGSPPSPYDDIPIRRLDLIRMYGRLPAEVRENIRGLIESLAYLSHPSRDKYERALSKTPMVHDE